MYQICRHIKTNGLPCESPALKGNPFCYYHSKVHTVGAEPHLRYGPLQLPPPEDAASILLSVARINDAIINNRIELKKATALLYSIQIASQFIDRKKPFDVNKAVQSAELTVQGDELAPGKYVCNENDECDECPFRTKDQCDRWFYEETGTQDPSPDDDDEDDDDTDDADDDSQDGVDADDDEGEESDDEEDEDDSDDDDGRSDVTPASLPAVVRASLPAPATLAPAPQSIPESSSRTSCREPCGHRSRPHALIAAARCKGNRRATRGKDRGTPSAAADSSIP
jgi:hypothetical protein